MATDMITSAILMIGTLIIVSVLIVIAVPRSVRRGRIDRVVD